MNLSDLIPAERVREIAETILEQRGDTPSYGWAQEYAVDCMLHHAPEIAAAVLEEAAKRFELGLTIAGYQSMAAIALRQMAKEIEP